LVIGNLRTDSALLIHRMLKVPPVHRLHFNVNKLRKSQKIAVKSANLRWSTGGDESFFVGYALAAECMRSAVGSQIWGFEGWDFDEVSL